MFARSALTSGRYFDRARSPAETIALIEPHFARLGITRIARQTGLDRIGIPCFAAIRPNSRSLSVTYGKGLDDACARAAAIMEAVEFAIAEDPGASRCVATGRALLEAGHAIFGCERLLPAGQSIDPDLEMIWAEGFDLLDRRPVFVPIDALTLGDALPPLTAIARTTNGLASGNTREEAIFQGLCELIERDALTLWSMQPAAIARASAVGADSFGDEVVLRLVRQIEATGLEVRLYDLTTDLGVPVVHAVISACTQDAQRTLFDQSGGTGCHPDAVRAALRAITEAAQSRMTNIAGSRDDVWPGEYHQSLTSELAALEHAPEAQRPAPVGLVGPRSLHDLMAFLHARLASCGIDDVVAVPLGGEEMGVSVVRVLSGKLEDQVANANWWPGARALTQLSDRIMA